MPVRSSVCTYSPSSANSSKYSTLNTLSTGQYKPLTQTSAGSTSRSSLTSSSLSSPSSSSTSFRSQFRGPGSASSRYSVSSASSTSSSSSSSSSSYSPLNSSPYSSLSSSSSSSSASNYSPSSSSSIGYYKSLNSSGNNSFISRYGNPTTTTTTTSIRANKNDNLNYNHHSPASRYSSGSSVTSLSSANSSSDYLTNHHLHHPRISDLSIGSTSGYSTGQYSQAADQQQQLPDGVPRGLVNLGNTCYMNAVLQALYSVESFRNHLLLRSNTSRISGSGDKVLTSELCELFKSMKGSTTSPISPANFKYAFSRYQAKFSGLGQQDAQEFLRYLINGVHEESNQAPRRPRRSVPLRAPETASEAWSQYRDIVDDSPLVDLVVGQLCSTIVCGQCQNKSHCWDPFWDLSLPLVRGRYSLKLSDVIDEFTAKETLDSDERPICSHCKRATRSTKQISLSRMPPVLILHLKKFTNDGYKLTSPDIKIDKQLTFNNGTTSYLLKACISHHGHSSSSGHYTSHCEYSSRWFHFNDGRVRDVSSTFDSSKLDDAYVLIYTQQGGGSLSSRRCSVTTSAHQSKL